MHFFWWSLLGYYKTQLSYIPALWVPRTAYQVTSAFALRRIQCHVLGSRDCHKKKSFQNYQSVITETDHWIDCNVFFDPTLEIIDRISKENAMTDTKNAQKREPDFRCSFCLSDHVGFEIRTLSSPMSPFLCYICLLSEQNEGHHSVVITSSKTHY